MSTTPFVMPNDLSDLCRVCLQLPDESQYLDLTTIYDEEDNLSYAECFTICTQIDLSAGEGIPHHLCKSCGLELQMSYDFYKKVEESKRVIQQCQNQIEENKANEQMLSSNEQLDKLNSDLQQGGCNILLMEKYVVSDVEEQITQNQENSVSHGHEQQYIQTSDVDDETGIDIINKMCRVEASTQRSMKQKENTNYHRVESMNDDNCDGGEQVGSEVESVTETECKSVNVVDHLEVEDYQNLEALEEETETIQMKCGYNIIPIQITKYKTNNEYEENEEFMEIAEDDDEEEENGNYIQKSINTEREKNLKWQENVVAVANKEHLPIEIEDDDDICEAVGDKNDHTVISESSQNDVVDEEEVEIESNKTSTKKKQSPDKDNKTRKRHVGTYSCEYCHRVYPNYSRMVAHRRCHEADRPKFTCSYCGRMYATKQAMECHIQTAHEKSGYNCSICNKVFAIRKSLEIHVRYHTGDFPYACKLCDRKFAQACHLNTHVNVKHNKIRFSCEFPNCGKYFTSSTSLRNHEFTHGVMPFECEYCKRGYPAKSKLRTHIKRKHNMDLSIEQLEKMRKFHVMRSKVNLVQFVEP